MTLAPSKGAVDIQKGDCAHLKAANSCCPEVASVGISCLDVEDADTQCPEVEAAWQMMSVGSRCQKVQLPAISVWNWKLQAVQAYLVIGFRHEP